MSDFRDKVFIAVCQIPRGKVATYGQIAAMAGSPLACRAVGNILHTNPFFKDIPCHRVVNSRGRLAKSFVFGGENIQKRILEEEGVKVNDNFVVDMKKYQLTIHSFHMPQSVEKVLNILDDNGYEGYLVGGCVRDYLLGKEASDFDITTNATPSELTDIFKEYRLIETGIKHGTVTVIIDNIPIEITTYRVDGEYRDNRRPEQVEYTRKLELDIVRRDFTMNSIAYNRKEGITDYCGGCADICRKVINTVGDANTRFNEDALRIMRAIRFSAVLGFEIEEKVKTAIKENKELLKNISKERIREELNKLILGRDAEKIIIEYAEIIGVLYPELLKMKGFQQNNKFHIYDVLTHCCKCMENVPDKIHLKLAALLHDIGKPFTYTEDKDGIGHFYGHAEKSVDIATGILKDLKYDKFTVERVTTLIKYHDTPIESNKKSVKRWLNKLSEEVLAELITLKRADNKAQAPEVSYRGKELDELEEVMNLVLKENSCFSLKDLDLNGNDLKAIGIVNGIEIGNILKELLELVIDEKIENVKVELLEQAKRIHDLR